MQTKILNEIGDGWDVEFTHNDVTTTRTIPLIADEEGQVDQAAMHERIEYLSKSIENKIEMGLIVPDVSIDPMLLKDNLKSKKD